MNNEPVAWIDEETGCFVYSQYDYEDLDEHGKDGLIPLYTHPVKEQEPDLYSEDGFPLWTTPQLKELTDEEIEYITKRWFNCHPDAKLTEEFAMPLYSVIDLCKAILRKAQEK